MKTKLTLIFLFLGSYCFGQNFNKLNGKDAVKVNGQINYSMNYLSNFNGEMSRTPFNWYLNGRLNISILDFDLPFTFAFSNAGSNFTQPFFISSIDPEYKWFKGHFGQTTMNFSQNTISGRPFLGGGIELSFKKYKIKAMFGRLNKAVENLENPNKITYTRLGGTIAAEFKVKNQRIEIILFKAKDLKQSLSHIPMNSEVLPKDNTIFESKFDLKLFRKIKLKLDYTFNILTENIRLEQTASSIHFLIERNQSTKFLHSVQAGLQVPFKNILIGIDYERIDPDFISLGNYFINNDLEKYALNFQAKLFKNKWNLSAQIGYQRTNLKQDSGSKTNRLLLNFQSNILVSKKINLSLLYNNFTNVTLGKDPTDQFYNPQFDSLKLYVSSQNANLTFNYRLGSKKKPQSFMLLSHYIQTKSYQGAFESINFIGKGISKNMEPAHVITNNISYNLNLKDQDLSLMFNLNYIWQSQKQSERHLLGPSVQFNKQIFNSQGSIGFATSYSYNKSILIQQNILNHQINFTYSPKFKNEKFGKTQFSLNASLLQNIEKNGYFNNQFSLFFQMGYSI